ncbi:MAG: cytochrome P450, partial [Mycobacteriaceae bacterium]|nr:cytochrome P450 [Mycobacteriaceae bacterium]
MALNTLDYVRDQARRRLTPTLNTVPGMGVIDRRLRARDWPQYVYAEPPPDSDLKPVMGDSGLPVLGHLIELFRGGPEYVLQMYRKYGPLHYSVMPGLNAVGALGPDAAQAVFVTRAKDFSQRAWEPVIGPFFHRGLMMLDFDEHRYHRRIMQEAFTRDRLAGYVGHIDRVAAA